MGLGQCISNTVLLDLCQLCEIDEKQYNMGPLMLKYTYKINYVSLGIGIGCILIVQTCAFQKT